jgi:HlyD family secretion protein
MLRSFTIVLSVVGLAVGVWAVATEKPDAPPLPLARAASVNPFERGVAALGVVEPVGRDVAVVSPESSLVTEVFVEVGDAVEKGAPLYQLDTRVLQAERLRAEAAVKVAEAEVARWHGLPRAEDVPPLESAVAGARAVLADREDFLRVTRAATAKGSGNERDIAAAQFASDAARAELAQAEAQLARLKAGGWRPDLDVAESTLAARRAEVAALTLLVERLTVRAPRKGTVLRRDIEAGEFSIADRLRPALILGDLTRLGVRAQVDEEDIGLLGAFAASAAQGGGPGGPQVGPRAVARLRGAINEEIELRLVRIEPYARPKSDLIGTNIERVDTRVIDVLFEVVAPPKTPIYPGQGLDVFIEAAAR